VAWRVWRNQILWQRAVKPRALAFTACNSHNEIECASNSTLTSHARYLTCRHRRSCWLMLTCGNILDLVLMAVEQRKASHACELIANFDRLVRHANVEQRAFDLCARTPHASRQALSP
jgi:hypothetical protein